MGKTTAQKGAHVVKDGIRHKDVYATAVGDITKAYLSFCAQIKDLQRSIVERFTDLDGMFCVSLFEKEAWSVVKAAWRHLFQAEDRDARCRPTIPPALTADEAEFTTRLTCFVLFLCPDRSHHGAVHRRGRLA